jgi:cation diffusion facilitator family transporter
LQQAMRLAGLTLAIDALLALLKVSIGVLADSHALTVSSLYSVNDVMSSIAVTVSLRLGQRRPTTEYAYGFGRAEFIAVAMVSLAISIGVFLAFVFSTSEIVKGVGAPPHFVAALLAAVSMGVSWTLARKNHRVAEALHSPALATSADHHHADAHGSLLALIGIGGALLGFHVFDRIIAAVESLHLVALSGTLLARAVNGLMDRALPIEDHTMLQSICSKVKGVRRVVHVRSRLLGSQTWVDVAVAVAPKLTVSQAHEIRHDVTDAVRGAIGGQLVTQVRFQTPHLNVLAPGTGGSDG